MTASRVAIERDERSARVIARVHGDIDSSNAADVITPLADETGTGTLVIDLSDVQYIDSAGMAAMEALRSTTEFCIVAPQSSVVRRALQIVGFDQLVPVFERIEEAGG